jgi:hypothetical protein
MGQFSVEKPVPPRVSSQWNPGSNRSQSRTKPRISLKAANGSGAVLTEAVYSGLMPGMGKAISPRGDMPKYRVPLFVSKDAPCHPSTASPPRSSLV